MAELPRPAPPDSEHAGFHYEPYEDTDWRLVKGKKCRHRRGGGRNQARFACGEPSVAELNRSYVGHENWWAYCGPHMYGRWVEDGKVMHWRLVKDDD